MAATITKTLKPDSSKKRNIIFIHPDLGLGGAERLIIDAAVGLQNLGHRVTILTSHCDPEHCFEEARDGTLDVRIRGHTVFPPTILDRFHILLATFRQIHLVLATCLFTNELAELKPEVFIIDQLSACVPLLRWLWPRNERVLFYCHFPDQLLARRDEQGWLGMVKRVYRWPFDWFEGWSMGGSDRVVVNSRFTRSVVEKVFGRDRLGELRVVYPCVNVESGQGEEQDEKPLWKNKKILLSINRFERKKDVGLAIKAFEGLTPEQRHNVRLVIAGGYDSRISENALYHKELEALADCLGLSHATAKNVPTALAIPSSIDVLFLLSVPGAFKSTLLRTAKLLIYTPPNEHFGIVPVEAMQYGVPVLASNTGGPLETVLDGKTGWLRDVKDVGAWTDVMSQVVNDADEAEIQMMGQAGKERVQSEFSRMKMSHTLEDQIEEMIRGRRKAFVERKDVIFALSVIGVFVAALFLTLMSIPDLSRPPRKHTQLNN
ncbi:hypothetical protein GJ744_002345 [Endocarpon pusillum]|uniref:Alpha-1,3/1,6-mannosyltransferase ALG2 n=1 Tax=Endocarpon pusillum TaxID=364733 RepID=A0A8H7AN30_9EURO|nr:hypothetical protein GJ744_002345 [Endocarpon pusillum]